MLETLGTEPEIIEATKEVIRSIEDALNTDQLTPEARKLSEEYLEYCKQYLKDRQYIYENYNV